jgi:dolichol-phosphate mannosyltransferase
MAEGCTITIVIPSYDEGKNISHLIAGIKKICEENKTSFEILVVDAGSSDDTVEKAVAAGAKAIVQTQPGYGMAVKEGFEAARGKYIITMDADLSHDPEFINAMIAKRDDADIIIASRYVPGGSADMNRLRQLLSIILNRLFCRILSLPYRDISSGYRFYTRESLQKIEITSRDFDVLEEILVEAHCRGLRIIEIPFHYKPRIHGRSHARLIQFGISYFKTLFRMWKLRRKSGM